LAARPLATVPCHNDLVAENVIDDGRSLRLVDWEYSGNGDPGFELGNACRELDYDEAATAELAEAYFGVASPGQLARLRLFAVASDAGWALWAALKAACSRLDLDFSDYGARRWARADGDDPADPRAPERSRRDPRLPRDRGRGHHRPRRGEPSRRRGGGAGGQVPARGRARRHVRLARRLLRHPALRARVRPPRQRRDDGGADPGEQGRAPRP